MTQSDPRNATVAGSADDVIHSHWLAALQAHQPSLPQPVALAMVDAVGRGPLGEPLRNIQAALTRLANSNLQDFTGSEARVLIAILRQMDDELELMEDRLNHLWEKS